MADPSLRQHLQFGGKVKALKGRENAAYQAFQESLSETLDAIAQIRAGNREGYYIRRAIAQADDIRATSTAFAWQSDAANRLSFTEARLHLALRGFLAGRTTLVIAHRLSAVRQADRVLVIEDGHVVDDGRHEDLIAGDGLYATLYRRQGH